MFKRRHDCWTRLPVSHWASLAHYQAFLVAGFVSEIISATAVLPKALEQGVICTQTMSTPLASVWKGVEKGFQLGSNHWASPPGKQPRTDSGSCLLVTCYPRCLRKEWVMLSDSGHNMQRWRSAWATGIGICFASAILQSCSRRVTDISPLISAPYCWHAGAPRVLMLKCSYLFAFHQICRANPASSRQTCFPLSLQERDDRSPPWGLSIA